MADLLDELLRRGLHEEGMERYRAATERLGPQLTRLAAQLCAARVFVRASVVDLDTDITLEWAPDDFDPARWYSSEPWRLVLRDNRGKVLTHVDSLSSARSHDRSVVSPPHAGAIAALLPRLLDQIMAYVQAADRLADVLAVVQTVPDAPAEVSADG